MFIPPSSQNETDNEPCACIRHPDGSLFFCEAHAPLIADYGKHILDLWRAVAITTMLMCLGFGVILYRIML